MMNKLPTVFFWVAFERIGTLGIQFLANIVLARLLLPEEFGKVGVLTIFLALSGLIADSGLAGALIREKDIKDNDFSTLFVYNGGISILLYLLIFLGAPFVALYYEDKELCNLLRVLATCVIINALGIVQNVKLIRALRMKELCIVSLVSAIISSVIGITMGVLKYGVWSLVMLQITNALALCISYYIVIREIPKIKFCKDSFIKQIKFGYNLVGANFVNIVGNNIPSVIIGKSYSMTLSGYFSQNNKIYTMANNILTTIIDKSLFSYLSKDLSKDMVLYEKMQDISKYLYLAVYPIFTIAIILSDSIISIILGPQWNESGWMLSILLIGCFPAITKSMQRSFFKILGKTNVIFFVELYTCIVTIPGIIVSSFISVQAILIVLSLSQFLGVFLLFIQNQKTLNISIWKQIKPILPFLICQIAICLPVYILKTYLKKNDLSDIFTVLVCVPGGLLLNIAYYFIVRNSTFMKCATYIANKANRI